MFFYEGYSCPVCGKAFDERDDIVVCPICGAPHHRDCFKQEGHCHYEENHGTDQQWSREKYATKQAEKNNTAAETVGANHTSLSQKCPRCGQENPEFAEFCFRCGHDLDVKDWASRENPASPASEQSPQPPFGGQYREYRPFQAPPTPQNTVPDDADLNGISADEFRQFVGQNAHYYLPRFLKMAKTNSTVSWNWPAFLLTPYWLWYRKQYFAGAITAFFQLFSTAITSLFLYGFLGLNGGAGYEEIANGLMPLMNNPSALRWIAILYLLSFLEILIRVMFGLFGNYFYYCSARRRIRTWKEKQSLSPLSALGGGSVLLGAIAYIACYFLSTVINFLFI